MDGRLKLTSNTLYNVSLYGLRLTLKRTVAKVLLVLIIFTISINSNRKPKINHFFFIYVKLSWSLFLFPSKLQESKCLQTYSKNNFNWYVSEIYILPIDPKEPNPKNIQRWLSFGKNNLRFARHYINHKTHLKRNVIQF